MQARHPRRRVSSGRQRHRLLQQRRQRAGRRCWRPTHSAHCQARSSLAQPRPRYRPSRKCTTTITTTTTHRVRTATCRLAAAAAAAAVVEGRCRRPAAEAAEARTLSRLGRGGRGASVARVRLAPRRPPAAPSVAAPGGRRGQAPRRLRARASTGRRTGLTRQGRPPHGWHRRRGLQQLRYRLGHRGQEGREQGRRRGRGPGLREGSSDARV